MPHGKAKRGAGTAHAIKGVGGGDIENAPCAAILDEEMAAVGDGHAFACGGAGYIADGSVNPLVVNAQPFGAGGGWGGGGCGVGGRSQPTHARACQQEDKEEERDAFVHGDLWGGVR